MRYGNCWLYAIPRFVREGGGLDIRWSPRNRLIPHVSWTRDFKTYYEFVPDKPYKGFWGLISAWCFRGKIQKRVNNVQK